jgi:hypothetical protein
VQNDFAIQLSSKGARGGRTQKGPYLAIYMRNPLGNLSAEKPQETSRKLFNMAFAR